MKIDKRDAVALARLYRAGELTAVYVLNPEDEAIRDIAWKAQLRLTHRYQAMSRLKKSKYYRGSHRTRISWIYVGHI